MLIIDLFCDIDPVRCRAECECVGSVGVGARMGVIGPEEHKVSEEVEEGREGDAEDRSISKRLGR
jgi:hypothetical protein